MKTVSLNGIALIVHALVGSLSAHAQSSIEEIRPHEYVGASQLSLKAFGPKLATRTAGGTSAASVVSIPPSEPPTAAKLEIQDARDKGYYLRVEDFCKEAGLCVYRWPMDTMRKAGLAPHMLWPLANIGDATREGALIPACVCSPKEARGRNSFVFLSSRSVNVKYYIYGQSGEALESGQLDNQPPGRPIIIVPQKAITPGTKYRLLINHIATTGGSAERFSDEFYFYNDSFL